MGRRAQCLGACGPSVPTRNPCSDTCGKKWLQWHSWVARNSSNQRTLKAFFRCRGNIGLLCGKHHEKLPDQKSSKGKYGRISQTQSLLSHVGKEIYLRSKYYEVQFRLQLLCYSGDREILGRILAKIYLQNRFRCQKSYRRGFRYSFCLRFPTTAQTLVSTKFIYYNYDCDVELYDIIDY